MAEVKELIKNHQDNVEESSFKDNFLHFLHGKNGTVIDICKYQIPLTDCTKVRIIFFFAQRQKDRTFVHPDITQFDLADLIHFFPLLTFAQTQKNC